MYEYFSILTQINMHNIILKNADLKKLHDDGYSIWIKDGYLHIENIPMLNSSWTITHTYLISPLELTGDDTTMSPSQHIMYNAELPYRKENASIVLNDHFGISQNQNVNGTMFHQLSRKPNGQQYADYYQKITTYTNILTISAEHIDPTVSAKKWIPSTIVNSETTLKHIDTNASRANIVHLNKIFETKKVAIIGTWWTGSYVLDLIARLPLQEIALFDDDEYSRHNFFRTPGCIEPIANKSKSQTLYGVYSSRHKNIVVNECKINESNLSLLDNFDFVFICIDSIAGRKTITDYLNQKRINYIDTGIGVGISEDGLFWQIRVLHSLSIEEVPENENDIYKQNIQIAELNSLSASIAVIEWKKKLEYYRIGKPWSNDIIIDIQSIW